MKNNLMFFGVMALLLNGCSVTPQVQYKIIDSHSAAEGMTDTFYRQRSEIEISLSDQKKVKDTYGNELLITEISIISTPKEYRKEKLGIKALSSWRSNTKVNINKIQNSDLVSSIGVEVADNTVKSISSLGGILVKMIGLFGMQLSGVPECISATSGSAVINLPDSLPGQQSEPMLFDGPAGKKGCIKIEFLPLPVDAIPASDLPTNTNTNNYYYSACRDAQVTVIQGGAGTGELKRIVRVSDPKWLQSVQFPAKGTITHHSSCGVSVVTEQTNGDNSLAIVDALAVQGKAIKDALEAAQKK